MPLRDGSLTAGEKAIAKAMADTGDRSYAQYVSGMTAGSVKNALQRDAVKAEIVTEQTRHLRDVLLPLAVKRLERTLSDDKVKPADHNQAVKIVFMYVLSRDTAVGDKQPHEMDRQEIDRALADARLRAAALASEQANRAKPVIEHEQAESDVFG